MAAWAGPFDKGDLSNLKERPKKQKCRPDGFGGKICIDPDEDDKLRTAPVYTRLLSSDGVPDREPAAATPAPAPARKATAAAASKSSAPALTVDDMVRNSINSKADVLGRELTPAEIADITAKVKAFMGSL